ncbi:MAG: CHAD domain-containing protein [Burkholderiales bacterium]|nr:CHAD domain-containing protein [Burkholderiales bacterium]
MQKLLKNKSDTDAKKLALERPSAEIRTRKNYSIERAFSSIVFNCIDQMLSNESGITSSYDMESLHQFRVGVRRLRSALTLYNKYVAIPCLLKSELDWLTRQLNDARDWDVFTTIVLPQLAISIDHNRDKTELVALANLSAEHMHKIAKEAIQSQRYILLLLNLHMWLYENAWREALSKKELMALHKDAFQLSQKQLKQAKRKLLKSDAKLRQSKPENIHKIRIKAKQVRYALEFFNELFSSRKYIRDIHRLSKLQTQLGNYNDMVVADRLLKTMQGQVGLTKISIGLVRENLNKIRRQNYVKTQHRWKKFRKSCK